MNISIVEASEENFDQMKGQVFVPHDGEGVMYVKFVLIKPETMEKGNPQEIVESSKGFLLCGRLDEMKSQIKRWFDEAARQYQGERKDRW